MASGKKSLKRASPSSIQDKFLVGYQGWFSCAGDGEPIYPGHSGWLHWFDGERPNLDVWPDVSSYSPSELFPARDLKLRTGEQAFLFSSRHPKTVQRHFHWMAEHGVDGAFLQRFAEQCQPGQERSIRRLRDEVGQLVRDAAEKEGRVFAIMYDVSNVPANRIQHILEHDWVHLIRNLCILDSPNYLKEKGRPVIGLWGLGFNNRGHTPELVRSIIKFFRTVTPGGAYVFGGAPSCWRLSEGDADRHPEFVDVWLNEFDAISPWTIGRYRNEIEADRFAESKMKDDMELIKRRNEETGKKVDYVPVVHPGGSGFNLSNGNWAFNDAPRVGGRFLWKQIFNAKRLGVRSIYGAMWDEYDEGTAFMPIVTHKRNIPQSDVYRFMALDEDGYDLPSDWYMRICGMAAEGLRSERWIHETFPLKELLDYWASRPKYDEIEMSAGETTAGPSGSGSKPKDEVGESGQVAYQEWVATQTENKDEPPPPPYSLVADESPTSTDGLTAQNQQTNAGPSSSTTALPASTSGTPTLPQVANSGESIPSVAQVLPVHSHATPPVVAIPGPSLSDVGPAFPITMPNLPTQTQVTSPVSSPYQSSYIQERPDVNVSIPDHTVSYPGMIPPGPLSPSPTSSGFQGQYQQRPQGPPDPVHSLATDFARTDITGPPPGSPREDSYFGAPSARPISSGGKDITSPPPLHPAHPAANNPALSGRPSFSRPQTSTQSYSPYRPNPSTPQSSGPWSTAQWPPKEWGVDSNPSPTPNDGANLGRLQTFSGSSSVNSGGANLRPSASIGGPPPPPRHGRPSTRPSTAGSGGSATPPVHSPVSNSFPQHSPQPDVSEYPSGFPEIPLRSTHTTPSPSGGYQPAPYHSTHTTPSPSGGYQPAPYHSTPSPPGGYQPAPYHSGSAASTPYHVPSHYYPQHHNVGGFMPSVPHVSSSPPFHYHHHGPSFPQPPMPTPWAPNTGPGIPVGPVGPVGPLGPVGPNSMYTGPIHPPHAGQYVPGTQSNARGPNNNALNYALSAVDMVAGRKKRDQLQDLAKKLMK